MCSRFTVRDSFASLLKAWLFFPCFHELCVKTVPAKMFCGEGDVTPAGSNDKRLCFSLIICRQSDGNTLCELWRSHREQAKPHMCCPKGERVRRRCLLSGHTEKRAGLVPRSRWVDLQVPFDPPCSLTVQCTWPRCCRCPDSCGQTAKVSLQRNLVYFLLGGLSLPQFYPSTPGAVSCIIAVCYIQPNNWKDQNVI